MLATPPYPPRTNWLVDTMTKNRMLDVPEVSDVLMACAMNGVIITLNQAYSIVEAIASCALDGVPIPSEADIVRIAKEMGE